MIWSKLKKSVESCFTSKLQGRIKLYSTIYRTTGNDKDGRAWIVIDKTEIYSACTSKWIKEMYLSDRFKDVEYQDAIQELKDEGILQQHEFYQSLEKYLNLSIDEALSSENVLIKSLAMIDKRLGKRRLRNIKLNENEHDLVKKLYKLRYQVESID